MADATLPESISFKPGPAFTVAMYLFSLAVVGRTVALIAVAPYLQGKIFWALGIEVLLLALFSLYLWRPATSRLLMHLYFFFQCALVVALEVIDPDLDFVTGLFYPLSYLAALYLCGRRRLVWIGIMVLLSFAPRMLFFSDPLGNLALELTNMAGIIVIAAYIAAGQEEEQAQAQSRAMLNQLRETHRQLQAYASQVEELAAIDERNRLARELHDSVSQTMFSIILNVRASQMLLERDPSRLRPQLERLHSLSQAALGEMRSLITQLRPKND